MGEQTCWDAQLVVHVGRREHDAVREGYSCRAQCAGASVSALVCDGEGCSSYSQSYVLCGRCGGGGAESGWHVVDCRRRRGPRYRGGRGGRGGCAGAGAAPAPAGGGRPACCRSWLADLALGAALAHGGEAAEAEVGVESQLLPLALLVDSPEACLVQPERRGVPHGRTRGRPSVDRTGFTRSRRVHRRLSGWREGRSGRGGCGGGCHLNLALAIVAYARAIRCWCGGRHDDFVLCTAVCTAVLMRGRRRRSGRGRHRRVVLVKHGSGLVKHGWMEE